MRTLPRQSWRTSNRDLRGVYDRYEHFDDKRHALELWATRLRSIVQPQPNVVELAQVRK